MTPSPRNWATATGLPRRPITWSTGIRLPAGSSCGRTISAAIPIAACSGIDWGATWRPIPSPSLATNTPRLICPAGPSRCGLLDGGACEGDALKILLRSGYAVERLYAWEPDVINYQKLAAYLRDHCADLRATLFPCGLGSGVSVVNFDGGRGTSSAISETGSDRLVVLDPDTAMGHEPVTLIKLDIEGAEGDAIRGMRQLIGKFHPGLAICVYHRADDMTEIPRQIQACGRPYRFYLRSHAWNTFETVLYALPIS